MEKTRDYGYPLPIRTGLNDLASFIMTSGSTGQPKIILRTNGNHLALSEVFHYCQEYKRNDIPLASGFCHFSGQHMLIESINGGAKLAILREEIDHGEVFKTINKYQITKALLTPPRLNYLAKNYSKYNKDYLKSFTRVWTGGAPASETTHQLIRKHFDFIYLQSGKHFIQIKIFNY